MPNPFQFADHLGVTPGSTIVSESITLSGLTAAVAVTATGCQVSITGQPYTTSGTANNGDTLTLQIVAPSGPGQSATCSLTVGGFTDVVNISTAGVAPSTGGSKGGGGGT